MTDQLQSQALRIQRPPSPTELSYTQLLKLTPQHRGGRSTLGGGQEVRSASATATATNPVNKLRPGPSLSLQNSNGFHGSAVKPTAAAVQDSSRIFENSQTHNNHITNGGPAMTPYPNRHHNLHNIQSMQQHPDRVANLAQKLSSMEPPSNTHSQSKQHDVQQFITMLQGMQRTVSRTTDEMQRNRKSQALTLLLNMFERVLEEGNGLRENSSEELDQLKQRVVQLEEDNEQLHNFCRGRDEELMRLHQELQQLNDDNDDLRQNLSRAQEECNEERKRAQEAELIASESESVRDGLFASYGQLTEANVDLERAIEECNAEKQALSRDLGYCKEEVSQLEMQCKILQQQLRDKDSEMAQAEKNVDDMHTQLASHRQSLEFANTHRHRLQDELHTSQRNATSVSQQLLEIREQYTKLQKETDAKLRSRQADESENSNLTIQLQEEQLKRKDLEAQISRFQSREMAAQEQIRKLARTNAELKTRINEMNARLDNREKFNDSCSVMSDLSFQRQKSANDDPAPNLLDYLQPDI
jgi:chromosome segregation ATPase